MANLQIPEPLNKPFPDGLVEVRFDAGGTASYVRPNPVRPAVEGGNLVIRWKILGSPLHANASFEAFFGNVVPSYWRHPYLADLKSTPDLDGQSWTWTWPIPDGMPLFEVGALVSYDLFLCYQMRQLLGGSKKPPLPLQSISMRQISSIDPTIILPPKAGGG